MAYLRPRERDWYSSALEYGATVLGLFVWLVVISRVPIVSQMGGVITLGTIAVLASILSTGPAVVSVVTSAMGSELLRAAPSWRIHIERGAVFALIGGGIVAVAVSRRAKLHASMQYRLLFEQNPMPMWVFDEASLQFLMVNEAASQLYGYAPEAFARMTLRDIRPAEDLAEFDKRPWTGLPERHGTWRHRTHDGRILDVLVRSHLVDVQGRPARLALIEDLTERRSLEQQLRHSQKMEAIGQLAGGIAHDFNNLLTAIEGYGTMLLESLDVEDRRRNDAQEITHAAQRAAALTRQLLMFSRKRLVDFRVVALNEAVTELMPMLRRLTPETIDVTTLMRAEGRVKVDPVQLQQVLMNLVVNARDAIGDGPGRITIETTEVALDEEYARQHAEANPGPYLMLAVSYTGHGIDQDTLTRIFEPFFTTKPPGRGTGLGLSTVYGIVKEFGGHIFVYSEVGHGTTFKVYIPSTNDAVVDVRESSVSRRRPPQGAGRILVLEDEDGVRKLVSRVLTQHGFEVHAAAQPSAAIQLARRPDFKIHLLVTDVVLPEMTGRDVANAIQLNQPDCQVLFMSGYTADTVLRQDLIEARSRFIEKPFTADGLLSKIAEVMASPDSSSPRPNDPADPPRTIAGR